LQEIELGIVLELKVPVLRMLSSYARSQVLI